MLFRSVKLAILAAEHHFSCHNSNRKRRWSKNRLKVSKWSPFLIRSTKNHPFEGPWETPTPGVTLAGDPHPGEGPLKGVPGGPPIPGGPYPGGGGTRGRGRLPMEWLLKSNTIHPKVKIYLKMNVYFNLPQNESLPQSSQSCLL